ncbi:40S ribosomal protein S12, mitochondrial [Camponotus floridanus]|uniref:Small ribosomal subunit protein uS12m n=1 Tax=Camponotus floridanus TaxID=104421 RepID=E2A364_CAMFO|nr:40S ribosomal protein S12, mitochondrial [Camponotus floridanus]
MIVTLSSSLPNWCRDSRTYGVIIGWHDKCEFTTLNEENEVSPFLNRYYYDNSDILLTVLGLTMPIFGEETQVKKQDKRGILGLGHAGFGGSAFQGDSLTIGTGLEQIRLGSTLWQMIRRNGPYKKRKPSKNPFGDQPFMKGVILKTVIKKPKKPNSANRKCVIVRLTNGREMTAYVPGIGHNLQEHNIVLCRSGRLRDVPGVKIKCVRGNDEVDPEYPSDTVNTMVHVSLCEGAADANSERIHPSSGTSENNGLRVGVCGNHGKCGLCSQKSSENLYTWERGGGTMN